MNKLVKTLIIEDEKPAIEILNFYLQSFDQLEVIGICENGLDAVKQIDTLKPDLIFLDIHLPKLTGIEVLELIHHQPEIIFTTAYNEFAIKAFDLNALDYLLKPFSKDRLNVAIQKVILKLNNENYNKNNTKELSEKLTNPQYFIQKIAIKNAVNIDIVNTNDIIMIESNGDYVNIYTKQQCYLKEQTMKYFEQFLSPDHFMRIHRSYIIKIETVKTIELYDKEQYLVITTSNHKAKASVQGYKKLKAFLKW